jgi:hypothetical protein
MTPTVTLTPTVFIPLVMRSVPWQITTLNLAPTTTHNVSITGMGALQSGDKVVVRLLSRRPGPTACVTEGYGDIEIVKP